MNRHQAAAYLPRFRDHKDIVAAIGAGTNGQLVRAILNNFPAAVAQTKTLAPRFNRGSLTGSAQAVWDFLKYQIKYKIDSGLAQHIKLPNALVATGSGDCKSYSLFAAGILANLGYKVSFKFTAYNGETVPAHVYVTATDGRSTVIVDAVWKAYNSEKRPYSYVKVYPMEIATISGIGCASCGGDIGKINLRKTLDKAKTAVKTAATKVTQNVVKPAAQLVKAAAGMAPRTAFLQLVKLNVHNFAGRLNKNREKALEKWAQLGGMKGELNASINSGMQRKPILGLDESYGISEPVSATVATTIAAAAPIIIAMINVLGPGKTTEAPSGETAAPATTGGESSTAQAANAAADIINAASRVIDNVAQRSAPRQENVPAPSGSASMMQPAGDSVRKTDVRSSEGSGNTMLYVGFGVLALLFLTN